MSSQGRSTRLPLSKESSFTSPGRSSRAPRNPSVQGNSGKRPASGIGRSHQRQKNNDDIRKENNNTADKKNMDAIDNLEVAMGETGSEIADGPNLEGEESVRREMLEMADTNQTPNTRVVSPTPEVEEEKPMTNPPANRPLSTYSEVIDPENFDSKYFLSSVTDLSAKLSEDRYQNLDPEVFTADLEVMVRAVSATLSSFQGYVAYSQTLAEGLRDQMKLIKDRMLKKIQQKAYNPSSATERLSLEERELEAKLAQLNKNLARVAEELARACAVSAESETAAMQAALVAERASAQAARTQAEYEARRDAELKKRREEEERRRANVERQQAEVERVERARREEVERRARLRRGNAPSGADAHIWESWPVYSYNKDPSEFDHGVTVVVRADPALVKESWLRAEVLNQREAGFIYGDTEQLVSNVVRLCPTTDGETLPASVYVALPHSTSRATAMTREPIIKALLDSAWVDLKSWEVTLDDKKDVKFVQAKVTDFTTLAVVTRLKRDFLKLSKRGGREISNVDSRVTFHAQDGTFKRTENFILQLQPVDSGTVNEVKALPRAAGLLCASSVVNMEWTSSHFELPITMTLPCPANPVKAKKAAALREAKEAKMKNPVPTARQVLEEAKKKEEHEDRPPAPKNRWYMGQYSMTDDDENDILYMVSRRNGKWIVVGDIDILQTRLDLLQFDLSHPIDTFMVLRTRSTVIAKEAILMANLIESHLSQSPAIAIVKQSADEFTDLRLTVAPLTKFEQLLHTLESHGYGYGPAPSAHLHLCEGDILEVNFRGNITRCDEPTEHTPPDETQDSAMTLVYNSHLETTLNFSVREVDRFLQKNYSMFRGFVQVFKEVRIPRSPTKADMEEGRTEPWVEVTKELITELLITIPKERASMPVQRPVITKAPILIKNANDLINEETLREVAAELGDEWKRLAQYLNIKRMRIQAIMRNCSQNEDDDCGLEEARFEMLLTWVKRVPRGVSKVPILCQALARSGRGDLAERLSDMDKEFKGQRRGP